MTFPSRQQSIGGAVDIPDDRGAPNRRAVFEAYLGAPLPRRSRPAVDALVALLSERGAMTRQAIQGALHLSYAGTVNLCERATTTGWVKSTMQAGQAGRRSVWLYSLVMPPGMATEGSPGVPHQGGEGPKRGVGGPKGGGRGDPLPPGGAEVSPCRIGRAP